MLSCYEGILKTDHPDLSTLYISLGLLYSNLMK